MISRRGFLGTVGATIAAHPLLSRAGQPNNRLRLRPGKRAVQPINTAKNLILVVMSGGPSHVDTFDLKTGGWTPDELGASTVNGISWPVGTMPKLGQRLDRMAVVRGISAETPLHSRGLFQLATGYRQTSGNANATPHLGSVLSAINDTGEEQLLPYGVSFSFFTPGNGLLALEHKLGGMNTQYGFPNLVHPIEGFDERFALLDQKQLSAGDPRAHFMNAQAQAQLMSRDERLLSLADFTGLPETDNYITDNFYRQAMLAVKTLGLNAGTGFVELDFGNWDHHTDIYGNAFPEYSLPALSRAFDDAFAYLLDELEAAPGKEPGKSLLDETLVVASGEFGRTPGNVDTNGGRDHYPNVSPAVLAGAGVGGGIVMGSSNANGAFVNDPGWGKDRPIRPGDLVATMYSALGVDYEGTVETALGQRWPLLDEDGPFYHISELFQGA